MAALDMANAEIWACPECGEKLDISDLGFYKEVTCPACAHQEVVHTQLANFRLTGVLGIGGMSVVFKANDMILNRPLAIKVLNDTYKDQPERIARFENECAMMARVRHDNVVSVYSAGWARGQFYIAMEQVRGRDLEHTVRRGKPLSPAAALDITREVSLGLQAAAQSGLLHRDMKPGNVLISQADGRAKVLDFGLSLGAQTEDTEEVIWATPFYVAPETLMREQEDVRTDIYALGMTLRFLLTGKDKLPQEYSSIVDLLDAKKKLRPFGEEMPGVTSALADLVNHMTAFEPSLRPPSYQELLQELEEALTIQKQEDSIKAPERIARKKKIRYIYVASTAFAALAGMVSTTLLSLPPPSQKYLAVNGGSKDALGDVAMLDEIAELASEGCWPAVVNGLETLNNRSDEPTLSAMAALLRYYLAYTGNDHEGMAHFLRAFDRHIACGAAPSPAAVRMHAQLKKVHELLHACGGVGEPDGVESALLRALVISFRVEHAAADGLLAAQRHVSQSKEAWQSAGFGFSKFASRLDFSDDRLLSICRKAYFAEIHKSMMAHDFSACKGRISEMRKELAPSDGESLRLDALQEIIDVADAAVDMLKKRFPNECYSGMQPAVMRDVAAKIKEEGLSQEVFCLGLLMKGDYAAAYEYNPYASDKDSSKPFAVLMRHWEKLLRGVADVSLAQKKPASAKSSASSDSAKPIPPLHICLETPERTAEAMHNVLNNNPSAATIIDGDGNGPLHWTLLSWGNPADAKIVVEKLFKEARDMNINLRNKAGETPLDVAVKRFGGDSSLALYLVERGATGASDPAESKYPEMRLSRLLYGIDKKDLAICRKALDNGADANGAVVRAKTLGSPGWTQVVELLLDKGMNPNCVNSNVEGAGLLHFATEPSTVELLLERGADPNLTRSDGRTPLFCTENPTIAGLLVKHGADVNFQAANGATPLHASWSGRLIEFLLANGADVNARMNNGATSVHMWRGGKEHTKKLLGYIISRGADVNARDNDGNSPALTFALTLTYPDEVDVMMEFLRKNGADLNMKNKSGETVLDVCTRRFGASNDCVKHLRKNGAKSGE